MTEEDLPFDKREIPEIEETQQEQKTVKRNYGNKYERNRNMISVVDTLFGQLEGIQQKRGFKTKGELLEYLVDLDRVIHPSLETIFECKKCHRPINALKDMNINRLVHKDLCKDSQCNGSIITKQKIKIEMLSGTTEAKTDLSGTTEAKTELSDTTEAKTELGSTKDNNDVIQKKKKLTIEEDEEEAIKNMDSDEFDKFVTSEKSYLELVDNV